MDKLIETNEELVFNRSGILEEIIDYGLDAEDAFFMEGWTERRFGGVLNIGAIDYGSVLVRVKLAFLGVRMIPFEEESGNIVIHGETEVALCLIPLEVDSRIQITLLIFGDVVVFLEGIA